MKNVASTGTSTGTSKYSVTCSVTDSATGAAGEHSMGAELLDKKQLLIDKKKYAFANIFAHAIVEAPFEYKYNNYIKLYE